MSGAVSGVCVSVWSRVWCGCQCVESFVLVPGVVCSVGLCVWSRVLWVSACGVVCVLCVSVSGIVCAVSVSVCKNLAKVA